jgi:hypothetical protein
VLSTCQATQSAHATAPTSGDGHHASKAGAALPDESLCKEELGGDLLMFGQMVRGLAMMPAEMPPVTVPPTTVIKLRW